MRQNIEKIVRRDRETYDEYDRRGRKNKDRSFRDFRKQRTSEKQNFVTSGLKVIHDFENYRLGD